MFSAKRGLSDVVTVSLIILLAIAAVVIVWTFVRPTLEGTGKQISSGNCLTVELKPVAPCLAATGIVQVENGAGETIVDSVKLVYYDANGNSETRESNDCTAISPLSRKTCTPTAAPPAGTNRVAVAAVLGSNTCAASTETVVCS